MWLTACLRFRLCALLASRPHRLPPFYTCWCGRPDPGAVDTARMLPVGQGVFVALVIMALVLIWVDIVAPF